MRANHPDMAERVRALAAHAPPARLLRCIEAVLECREALAINVKPKFAVDAMVAGDRPGAPRLIFGSRGCRRLAGHATLAQSVERLTRNEQVSGSIPLGGSALLPR